VARIPPLLRKRQPIILIGQSNIAGGYRPISEWPERLRSNQLCVPRCHNLVCYGPVAADRPVNASSLDATWKPVQSFTVTSGDLAGVPVGNWGIDLADGLLGAGINAALIEYCVGGTMLEYWTAGAVGSQYPAILAWVRARIAELEDPLAPLLVFYHGESGSTGSYSDLLVDMLDGWRADFGLPEMGLVEVQLPTSYAPGAAVATAQASFVAASANVRLAYCHDSSFVDTEPTGLHIDTASGRRLAVGSATSMNRSVLSAIRELLA